MPVLTTPDATTGSAAHAALFGGNILAPRAHMKGPGSYAEAIEELGVTGLRYPGGSLTEKMFSLRDPDADRVFEPDLGREVDFIPMSGFMQYAEQTGRDVTIVIPTRDQLSDEALDANGDRMPAIDRDVLSQFVRGTVSGEYGAANVAAFEIGNEYWGSGEMNAAEYGRLAADMAQVIDRTLNELAPTHPGAAQVDVLVQVGTNFGHSDLSDDYAGMAPADVVAEVNAAYGLSLDESVIYPSGDIDWTEINNEILLSHFDDDAMAATDGVIAHVYSRAPVVEHSRWFQLEQIEEHWQSIHPELEIHVTEWNQKSNTGAFDESRDYGLWQAQEMLEQVEEFMRMDVASAQVWPLIQNTPTALALGREFDETTPPGEMFAMLSENLPGMRMLDFAPQDERGTEMETAEMDVHAFADGQDMLFYFTSNLQQGVADSEVDISNLVEGFGEMEITVLGVARGDGPGSTQSRASVDHPDPEELHVDGLIETVLAPGEIMQVRLTDVVPTADFAKTFADTGSPRVEADGVAVPPDDTDDDGDDADADDPDASSVGGQGVMASLTESAPAPSEGGGSSPDGDGDDGGDEGGSDMGGLWLIGLLPLMFLLG
ncbi:hypothetical protein [Sagittula stellata]|uniref:Type I secretion target repeat protein n=1 Tax=Sagittula stellata (strain ATCC 700073 / DSM 11524 / E-37) TaxID=388399 RepID=A3K5L0_SAGS3|nr:hypothetical protein [Sagittula stellata]EBA07399.1 type I secretion target repeat protein [Sagittula stellata E-37]